MEFNNEECLTIYEAMKSYYTTLLKQHYLEEETHGNNTQLYKDQEEKLKNIISIKNRVLKIVDKEEYNRTTPSADQLFQDLGFSKVPSESLKIREYEKKSCRGTFAAVSFDGYSEDLYIDLNYPDSSICISKELLKTILKLIKEIKEQ